MKQKKKNNKIYLPEVKKDLKAFLTSEEGRINKKNLVKIGTILFVASKLLQQGITQGAEAPEFKNIPDVTHQAKKIAFSSHVSHASHASHASHSSHSSHTSHASHASHSSHSSHTSHASHASHSSHSSHTSHASHASHSSHTSHASCCCGTTAYGYAG
jgi:hypothetical protein